MNVLSLNIRGMGEPHKLSWLRRLRSEHKLSFCCIQETQLSSLSRCDLSASWGDDDFDFDSVDAVGRSGGVISIWEKGKFQKIATIKDRFFLAVAGYWNGVLGETIFVNVYAPQELSEKKLLWTKIANLIDSRTGNWIVLGDFNSVRKKEERFNSSFCPYTAAAFNNFIQDTGLIEPNMGGGVDSPTSATTEPNIIFFFFPGISDSCLS